MPSVLYSTTIFIIGVLSAEIYAYFWHRWVAHLGLLKRITPYDFLRKRHAQHHEINYNPKINPKLVTESYVDACEVTFNILVLLVLAILLGFVFAGHMSWWTFGAYFGGILFFALVFAIPFHTYYHLTDKSLRKKTLFKLGLWKQFKWLQSYHEAHHYYNCNYAIFIPVDIIFGSYMSPAVFQALKGKNKIKKENIFPGFTNSVSGCNEPLFVE